MNSIFPLGESIGQIERKYADAPSDVPLDSDHPIYLGNSITPRQRRGVLLVCVAVCMIFLLRIAQLQLVLGAEYRSLAEGNRLRILPTPAKRGLILDERGTILAENVPSFFASVVPEYLPKEPSLRVEVIAQIADSIGINPAEIEDELEIRSRDESEPVLIHHELTKEVALKAMVDLRNVKSAIITVGSRRSYPFSSDVKSLSHLLGYEGKLRREDLSTFLQRGYLRSDLYGKTGLEASYENELRGTYGNKKVEVDVLGNIERIIASTAKVDGSTLKLSIDLRLQEASEKALRDVLRKTGTKRGSVVAMDPRNGRVRALVSWPGYDNNLFGGGIKREDYEALLADENQPLFNRTISGEYPSGSTLKIVYAGAALAEGVITESTTVKSTGGLRIGQWFFPDWKPGGHGLVNVKTALAWSVNTFFYLISGGHDNFRGLGIDKMGEWARRFGLAEKLAIDIPGERPGFFPSPQWKEDVKKEQWYIGDTYHAGIGQGTVLVTPLQVAAYTSVFANSGTLYAPTLAYSFKAPDMPEREIAPRILGDKILSVENINIVKRGMREAVVYGSARALNDLPFAAAGKTGTAQFQSDKNPHAWFTGFAPYEKPELVVTVLIEEGIEGSTNAVPVAEQIMRAWWTLRH